MNNNSNYKLSGRVDGTNADRYEQEISALLDNANDVFSIDLSSLTYISSLGLRLLLKTAKTLKEHNKKLIKEFTIDKVALERFLHEHLPKKDVANPDKSIQQFLVHLVQLQNLHDCHLSINYQVVL